MLSGAKFKRVAYMQWSILKIGGLTNKMLVRVISDWFDGKTSDDFLDAAFLWFAVDHLTLIHNLTFWDIE